VSAPRGWEELAIALEARLAAFDSLGVAFSGGVDSSVLAHAARKVLGARATALIAVSPSLAARELDSARTTAAAIGIELVELATDEFERAGYLANDGARCYHCKSALFDVMAQWGTRTGVRDLAFGEIADDLLDERPGRRAAREARVHAPLAECGFSKDDVRRWAREHALPVAEKPAAPCLASRLPRGTPVTRERLARIERAEAALADLGLSVLRVRDHGALARVEVGADELAHARSCAGPLARRLLEAGFDEWELGPYVEPTQR
jgi:uncharacterized protein